MHRDKITNHRSRLGKASPISKIVCTHARKPRAVRRIEQVTAPPRGALGLTIPEAFLLRADEVIE